MSRRRRLHITAIATGFALASCAVTAFAQAPDAPVLLAPPATGPVKTLPDSPVVDVSETAGSTKTRPAFRLLPQFVPGSEDWVRPYADVLDNEYNKWLAFKKSIDDQYKLSFGIDY